MSSLEQLAASVRDNAFVVAGFLKEHGHSEFSFKPDSPTRFPPDATSEVLSARQDLIWASRQIQYLAMGPTESLLALSGATDAVTTRWIYHYNIPAAVPIDTGISFADLARKVNLSERTLTRILRHTMTNNIFVEDAPGHISHTSYSHLLVKPGNPIRGMVGHRSEVMFPIMSKLVEAHDKYGTADQSANHTGFQVAFSSKERMLDWVASDPVASVRFAESMKTAASSGPFNTQYIAQSFDWDSLKDGVVVDVGGSTGHASKVIASAAPSLSFIVQDLPAMVAQGEKDLEPIFRGRFQFQAHNFFDANSVQEPAAFLVRWVLHDWPDSDCVLILRRLAQNMGPKTNLLINDVVVPPKGSVHPLREKYIRDMDIVMMSAFNSMERNIDEWTSLISQADPVLKVVGVTTPHGSGMSMIQVRKIQK